ncbi:MAG: hypothetical protein MK212_00750 [Saprospiraceae bacterium]|nr:hypothetical protein [Saprospiraceae bacterium]
MSIPKEPRALMVNLMYLVLTAMLALNVSAEIMNAFFKLDKGNQQSMKIVDDQLTATVTNLKELLKDDTKAKYRPLGPATDEVRSTVKEFIQYVEGLRTELIDEGGNKNGSVDDEDYMESHGKKVPKGKKNKDITTRLLVDGENAKGEELKQKIMATRTKLLKIYGDLLDKSGKDFGLKDKDIKEYKANAEANMTLGVDDQEWQDAHKKSWEEHTFKQMPLAAVLPLLSQMQANARTAEADLVNKMAKLSGGKVVEFDKFFPMISARKAYVIKGEKFEAEVSVGTYSSQINPSDVTLTVNGSRLNVGADGKAQYTASANQLGKKTLKLGCSVRNPLTDEVKKGESTFEYEVGERSATVSADKMNVFYVGVDNPISVSASGVPSQQLKVNCTGATMKGSGSSRTITAKKPGDCTITLSGGGLTPTKFKFRVKKIPNPTAYLTNGKMDGQVKSGTMRVQGGIIAKLENFDFDARCKIQSYDMYYTPKRQDPVPIMGNKGGTFTGKSKKAVQQAKNGDVYQFVNVKARCPGDTNGRLINGLSFNVK